ncbi:exonuclease V subunit beta [Candidatus Magnetomorum sp. HK-1]|nr:exonuclease V subunit beta [Candidatus Magnetomorum sp. HK-1]
MNNSQLKSFDLPQCPLKDTNLIEASAGTGKTYTICGLYARLIIEKEKSVSDILVVTFTEAATEELRDRIRKILYDIYVIYVRALNDPEYIVQSCDAFIESIINKSPPNKKRVQCLEMAIRNFDEAAIYTIHGFCHRILQENSFESRVIFDAELLTDSSQLIQEIADDFFRKNFYEAHPLFLKYAQKIKHTPDTMREWVQFMISTPFLELIPDIRKPSDEDILRLEKAYIDLFQQTKKVFDRHHAYILDLMLNDKGLKRTRYQVRHIPNWIQKLSEFFSSEEIPKFPDDVLQRFQACKIAEETKKDHFPPEHIFFNYCEQLIVTYTELTDLYESKMAYIKKEWLKTAHAVLFEKKKKLQIQTFDDLLYYVHQALQDGPGSMLAKTIRKNYQAALIDEFQDTDPIQYSIFNTIFNHPESVLYIIGDPKQAIYSFRGADLFAYLKGAENAKNKYTLDQNWRSSPLLIDSINALFLSNPQVFVYSKMNYHQVSPALSSAQMTLGKEFTPQIPFQILYMGPDDKGKALSKERARDFICKTVSAHISNLLQMGKNSQAYIKDDPVLPGDIAILVRKNLEARQIQLELQDCGISSVVYSQERVWESNICRDMAHVLSAVADYQNDQRLKSALTTSIIGINADHLFQLISNSHQWDYWIERFQEYHEIWLKKGFMVMFRLFLSRENVRARILKHERGERYLTDILHIAELLHQVDMEKKPGMTGLLEYFNRYRAGEQHSKHEAHIRLETDENSVKIVTVHKSKGLQYKIVYCPFIWEGARLKTEKPYVFHDPNNNDTLTLPLTAKSRTDCLDTAEIEYLAENMRLLYVAVTRAQYQCYLVHGNFNKSAANAFSWLLHGGDYLNEHAWSNDIVSKFEAYIKSMPQETILTRLYQLEEKSNGSIQVCFETWPLPKISRELNNSNIYDKNQSHTINLDCRTVQQKIDSSWRISSFSALTTKAHYASEMPDRDSFLQTGSSEEIIQSKPKEPTPLSIFAFPKGARPGTFLHDLLEHVDFKDDNDSKIETLITEKLSAYGYGIEWKKTLQTLIHRVKDARLSIDDLDFRLQNISSEHQINELGFYFPVTKIQPSEITAILNSIPWVKRSKIPLYTLEFNEIRGMMKGFVDLIFSYQNKYYIVDWKSNYLGPELKDYSNKSMKRAILEHYYILQYYIYTLALHRYLKQRIKDYDYEKHFGGIYYLFLRGLDKNSTGKYGIFRDRPEYDAINAMDTFFKRGSHFFFEQTKYLTQSELFTKMY